MSSKWKIELCAEPVIKPWSVQADCNTNGAELQLAILRGFADKGQQQAVWTDKHEAFTFEKTFTAREHGEFFRGALTMAGIRYAGDFYDLLQRYGTIKVTITKFEVRTP